MNLCRDSNVHINDLVKINSVNASDWTFKNILNLNWDDHLSKKHNMNKEDALNSKLYKLCIQEGNHTQGSYMAIDLNYIKYMQLHTNLSKTI